MDMNDGNVSGPSGQGPQSDAKVSLAEAGTGGASDVGPPGDAAGAGRSPVHPRLQAMILAGRYHGIELDPEEFRLAAGENVPSAASLSNWAQNSGMWSRAVRLRWRHLMRFHNTGP